MKTHLDCIPCFARQALEAARRISPDPACHERVLRDVLRWAADMDMSWPPPVLGQRLHRRLREVVGLEDPYREVKDAQNRLAESVVAGLEADIAAAADPLDLAVRGAPVINDATRDDAKAAGLERFAEIIDNGSDAPATVLGDCGPEFLRRYAEADLVLAKGQGNYESLGEERREIVFLFKVKCPVIARHAGFPVGTHVLMRRGKKP